MRGLFDAGSNAVSGAVEASWDARRQLSRHVGSG